MKSTWISAQFLVKGTFTAELSLFYLVLPHTCYNTFETLKRFKR